MSTTYFLWDEAGQNIIEEFDDNFDKTVEYTHEPGLYGGVISQRRDDLTSFYHEDALGSTVALTDEGENVTDSYGFDAWGNEVSHTGTTENPFRWNGQAGYYFDNHAREYNVRQRVYQPTIARWISVDPLFDETLTIYVYAANSPLVQTDSSGEKLDIIRTDENSNPECDAPKAGVSWRFSLTRWPCRGNRGFFIQRVTVNCQYCGCDDRIIGKNNKQVSPCPTNRFHYFEKWDVTRQRPFALDTAYFPSKGRRGHYRQGGVVKFFCEKPKGPPPIAGEIKDPGWTSKSEKRMGPSGCGTTAGGLPRFLPAKGETWKPWNTPGADGPSTRNFYIVWDCCCKDEREAHANARP